MTYRDTKEKCHHTLRLHIPEHFKSFSLVLLTELMQSAGVGEFVLVFSRAIFWPCGQDKHKKLTDRFTHQNVFSVDWKHIERERAANVTFMHFLRSFSYIFYFLFYFYTCNREKQYQKTQKQMLPFDGSSECRSSGFIFQGWLLKWRNERWMTSEA